MFILINWVKYYTKEIARALRIASIGACIILLAIWIKYQPAYEVSLAGEKLGYIQNKNEMEAEVKNYMADTTGNIAFREQSHVPEYQPKLVSRNEQMQESEVIAAIEKEITTTYKTYAVLVDEQIKATVATEEEAKTIVDTMKADVTEEVGLNVGIIEQFTTDYDVQSTEEAVGILNEIKVAKVSEYNAVQDAKRKQEELEAKQKEEEEKKVKSVGTIAGISLSRPIEGTITSRFGSRSSIRSGSHTGLDIGASSGTPVHPIAEGTVTFADYKGSYGNLVKIDHGNGIESYYAHCSKIYVTVGQTVDLNTVISAVGSTGNSTGPHLHVEIRQDGTPLNPEKYLY